ncbi:recombination mediator RecR [[Mycoplasma] testudinis]|uniref:recombination mediator RecR n=1 Tax=[Mycoplasma] testudinis TaxID=33924 RepID=UPI000481F027|nr:recombination mediator RecR [[Mycoplasma] testudinis]
MKYEFIEFEYLVDAIRVLPGIGTKSARKIAFFLIKKDHRFIKEFIERLNHARSSILACINCGNWSKDNICEICNSSNREKDKLCIVATVDDLMTIESCQGFNGVYHVLNGELSKAKNINPEHLNLDTLIPRIKREKIKEVLIATNFTIEGELTANYIKILLKDSDVSIFRIAFGLPVNSQIDYADGMTLKLAIENKNKIK